MENHSKAKRTQTERTRASREKIILAATEYFASHGYQGARLADIARAANLTEPGLLHHFSSKTKLFMAVLAERDRIDHEHFDLSDQNGAGDPLASALKLVEHNETVPGLVQLFTTLVAESIRPDHPGHDFFQKRYQMVRDGAVEVIREAQARGEIRGDIQAEDLAIMVYAIMDGLQLQWLYEPEKVDMARLFNQFVSLFTT